MLSFIRLLSLVFSLLSLSVSAQNKKSKINYEKEGYVKARVIKYEVENCGYLLELDGKEKTKLTPDKLDDAFKKDKQKVWVKYSFVKKQPMSTCMGGKLVVISDIRKRK